MKAIFDRRRLRDADGRRMILASLEAGLEAVDPERLVKAAVDVQGGVLRVLDRSIPLGDRRLWILGIGKASPSMVRAAETALGNALAGGVAVSPHGQECTPRRVVWQTAGHPLPDEGSLAAAAAVIEFATHVDSGDVVLCLLSGGGSSLLASPAEGITLDDLRAALRALLECGATIDEMNTVRRHLTTLQGGRLAERLYPAEVHALLLSDVVGNALETIASGPTVPDPTTFADARAVLVRRGIWETIPDSVRTRINGGIEQRIPETPKPGDRVFARTTARILADGRTFVEAASREARRAGWCVVEPPVLLVGEAKDVGRIYGRSLREDRKRRTAGTAWIGAGETTVTVLGGGRGGRNQELALSASLELEGVPGVALACFATDGVDGPTDAAGAVVDGETSRLGSENGGIGAAQALADNDAYPFLAASGDLLWTGPTGTNVADIVIGLVLPD